MFAVVLLYLWLAAAYAIAAKRSGRRHWWGSGIALLNLLPILWILGTDVYHQFDPELQILFAIPFLTPFVLIVAGLFGKGKISPNYPPRAMLLFRHPNEPPPPAPQARR